MPWHSIHVHYHDPSGVDALLLDAVRPLFASVVDAVEASYYVRHWRQGPHLRLNLCTDPDRFAEVVLPAARQGVAGYLAAHPSTADVDPQALLPLHQRLAALEPDPGPLLPWRPDNSLHVAPYDRRVEVLGSAAAADLLAEFLTATTGLAFEMTDHLRAGGQRLRLAFDLMVAVAHGLSGVGITRGFISYRSHAEVFLCTWPEGRGQREGWDRWYHAHAEQLVGRVRAVVAALDSGQQPDSATVPFVSAWVSALRPFQARGERLIRSGELSLDHRPAGWDPARLGMPPATQASPLHRALAANDEFMRVIAPSVPFAVWRLLLNYQYLQLTRLGITPVERFLLGHLVANAVEDCYGLLAMDLVSKGVRS